MERHVNTDLAYLAGFIDGEGSITIFFSVNRFHARLDIYNTNKEVLNWIKEKFGGRVHAIKQNKETWKQECVWTAGQQVAASILSACLPYLKIKRQQAEIFLAFALNSKDRVGKRLSPEMVEYRKELADKIQYLNKRGRN